MTAEELVLTLLRLPRIGRATVQKLLDAKPDTDSQALSRLLQSPAFGSKRIDSTLIEDALEESRRELAQCDKLGITTLACINPRFPASLRTIPDPPVALFVKGNVEILHLDSIAVIGTREPSKFGREVAFRIAATVAERRIVVTSGLALGCDTAAHLGALSHHGLTVAVLAHGLDSVYPRQNAALAADIIANRGALVSEYAINTPPRRGNFVARDRLQSGLSRAVIVVETGLAGGAMHTVSFAHAQRRAVATVAHPERMSDMEQMHGNRQLINRKLAKPLWNSDDLGSFLDSVLATSPPLHPKEEAPELAW